VVVDAVRVVVRLVLVWAGLGLVKVQVHLHQLAVFLELVHVNERSAQLRGLVRKGTEDRAESAATGTIATERQLVPVRMVQLLKPAGEAFRAKKGQTKRTCCAPWGTRPAEGIAARRGHRDPRVGQSHRGRPSRSSGGCRRQSCRLGPRESWCSLVARTGFVVGPCHRGSPSSPSPCTGSFGNGIYFRLEFNFFLIIFSPCCKDVS